MLTLDEAGLPRVDGRPLKLPPKERAVLRLLLGRAPGLVSKDGFAAEAWAGQGMSDESLAQCISRVRRAVLPHGLMVEVVYGLGYRLVEQAAPFRNVSMPSAQAVDSHGHARQLMLQRTPEAMTLAVDLLRQLVRQEPDFAAARVALADSLGIAVGWGLVPTPPAVDEGLAALAVLDGHGASGGSGKSGRSGAMVPGLHAARGALLDMAWRFDEARRCFDVALATDGESIDTLLAVARHLLYTDQAEQAVGVLRRVRKLSPHALHVRMTLTRALVQCGRGAEAVGEAQATVVDNPGLLVTVAFSLAIQAMVAPHAVLETAALRLMQGLDTPIFVWTVASFVLSRLGRREATLDIVDTALLCSRTTAGEATLYAAPLAALGEFDRAAGLLRAAVDERCGMMAMVLRDPAHAHWLPRHPVGRELLRDVFGRALDTRLPVPVDTTRGS